MITMKTNRAFLLCIVLLLVGVKANSQHLFWIKGGTNISRVTGNKSDLFSPKLGYQYGIGFEKIFSNPLGVKMELFLNEKGFHSENVAMPNTQDGLIDNQVNQTSLLIPVVLTLHLKRLFFEGGFSFDLLLRSSQYLKETYNSSKPAPVVEIQENVHDFNNPELGYLVGAGVKLYKGLYLSGRYTQALTPIGVDYNWKRMSYIQFALNVRLGDMFTPKPITVNSSTMQSETSRPYELLAERNISRVNFVREGDGDQVKFRFQSVESGNLQVTDVTLESSTGFVNLDGVRSSIREASFPLTCRMRYVVTNPLTSNRYESYIEFQIKEAGIWNISIQNN